MDPILATLSTAQLALVEGQLSNDDVSPDDEIMERFIEAGLTEEQGRQALTYRDRYLNAMYLDGYTPIRNPGVVLRYDPYKRDFIPE